MLLWARKPPLNYHSVAPSHIGVTFDLRPSKSLGADVGHGVGFAQPAP